MEPSNTRIGEFWADIKQRAQTNDWLAQALLEDGSVRDTSPLQSDLRRTAQQIIESINPQPKQCWVNARRASVFEECQYVEGLTLVGDFSPFEHAWVEIEDQVIELTMREKPDTPENSIYIGIEYSGDDIEEAATQNRYDTAVTDGLEFLRQTSM